MNRFAFLGLVEGGGALPLKGSRLKVKEDVTCGIHVFMCQNRGEIFCEKVDVYNFLRR